MRRSTKILRMKITPSIAVPLLATIFLLIAIFHISSSTNAPKGDVPQFSSFSPKNAPNSVDRVKRNSEASHAIKSFGITILALVAGSIVLGIDYSVTTIFTPLMIITLTKNIDVKAIIDTCNYRRQQHLTSQNGDQNWTKALFCMPTEDEASVHKRRFFLDVMKVAFKHVKPKTIQLIQKEYGKYLKLTEYMDQSKKAEWNAPKTTRTLLIFFANYGLIDPNELEELPKFITADDIQREMGPAMREAVEDLYLTDKEFLEEEIQNAKARYPKNAAQIDAEMERFKREVDLEMKRAERKVMEDYQKNSLNFKIKEKLKAVSRSMRKLVGWPVDEKDQKKQTEEYEKEVAYRKYLSGIRKKKDAELTIVEKIDKYGLLNFEIVSQTFLEQLTRDLAYAHGTLVRSMSADHWQRKWDGISTAAIRLGNQSQLKVDSRMEKAKLDFKSEKAAGDEMMEKMRAEERMERHFDISLYLDPATLANYPKIFQQLLQKAFDEEIEKMKNPQKLTELFVIEDAISLREVYMELAKMPLHVKKLYIQYGLVRTVVALLKELFAKEDDPNPKVQKYYLMFLYERKPVHDLFNILRIETSKNLAPALRKEIFEQMKKNGRFNGHKEFLEKYKLADKIQNLWVNLPPRQAFDKSEAKIIEICKGWWTSFSEWWKGHPNAYKSAAHCAVAEARPLMELYKHFLWLSNQFRIARQKQDPIQIVKAKSAEEYNESEEEVDKFKQIESVENVSPKSEQLILDQQADKLRVSRILDAIILDQKMAFREIVEENEIHFEPKETMKFVINKGKNGGNKIVGMEQIKKSGMDNNPMLANKNNLLVEVNARRKKRFIFSTVLINIMRTAGWMQLFKHFNVIEIIRDCIVRSINFQQWTCEYPAAIKAEQNFIHKLKRIMMDGMGWEALPKIRRLYDNYVRKNVVGQKRPSPSELLAESDLVIPFKWEDILNEYSYEVWKQNKKFFVKKFEIESKNEEKGGEN